MGGPATGRAPSGRAQSAVAQEPPEGQDAGQVTRAHISVVEMRAKLRQRSAQPCKSQGSRGASWSCKTFGLFAPRGACGACGGAFVGPPRPIQSQLCISRRQIHARSLHARCTLLPRSFHAPSMLLARSLHAPCALLARSFRDFPHLAHARGHAHGVARRLGRRASRKATFWPIARSERRSGGPEPYRGKNEPDSKNPPTPRSLPHAWPCRFPV